MRKALYLALAIAAATPALPGAAAMPPTLVYAPTYSDFLFQPTPYVSSPGYGYVDPYYSQTALPVWDPQGVAYTPPNPYPAPVNYSYSSVPTSYGYSVPTSYGYNASQSFYVPPTSTFSVNAGSVHYTNSQQGMGYGTPPINTSQLQLGRNLSFSQSSIPGTPLRSSALSLGGVTLFSNNVPGGFVPQPYGYYPPVQQPYYPPQQQAYFPPQQQPYYPPQQAYYPQPGPNLGYQRQPVHHHPNGNAWGYYRHHEDNDEQGEHEHRHEAQTPRYVSQPAPVQYNAYEPRHHHHDAEHYAPRPQVVVPQVQARWVPPAPQHFEGHGNGRDEDHHGREHEGHGHHGHGD